MKKLICALLVLCLLAGTLVSACAEAESRHYTREFTFYVIDEDPDFMKQTMLFYFDGVDDLPWLDVEQLGDLVNELEQRVYDDPDFNLTYSAEDSVALLTRENGYSMKLDFDANTITFDDYNGFLKKSRESALLDTLSFSGFDADGQAELFQRDVQASFDRYGDMMVLKLADYDIGLIHEGNRYYIPLQTANDFVFSPLFYRSILCNGEAMFLVNARDLYSKSENQLTALGEIYYSAQPAMRSQELADFGYNELRMMLDHMYGLKAKHSIEDFGRMFWQVGFDEALVSVDPADADMALQNFINYYLDDLHSSFSLTSWMTGFGSLETKEGPSSRLDSAHDDRYSALRRAGMGEDWTAYQEVGNTAYITFDAFQAPGDVDYYGLGPEDEAPAGTLGLVIHAHRQIYREGSPIENVVIDLSNNYGGEADAAVFLLSWLLGDAEISLEDTFTGAQSTLVYRADVNLDRCFDANDTLDDKHVYVLISPVSFSCGNLVPAVCKYHQAATLIGRTTGGGACVVQPMSTAWGTLFQISGAKRLSFRKNGSFYDIDEGVEPDIYIDRLENLYDREALTAMINALS